MALLLQTLTYIDRSNVSFASLQFKGDLHLTAQQFGLGAGVLSLPNMLFTGLSHLQNLFH